MSATRIYKLEARLAYAAVIADQAEHEVDLLRQVLLGQIGTKAQRSTLIRIINDNKPKVNIHAKLARQLGITPPARGTYCNSSVANQADLLLT